MTCQECQPLVIDLARGLPPFDVGGAVQRADVLSHIATCTRCSEWLREQEALSDALRAAAEADVSLAAPPGVEANVMAAFRASQARRQLSLVSPRSSLVSPGPVLVRAEPFDHVGKPEQLPRERRPAWPAWPAWPAGRASAFAAAAIIVIAALTMASLRWLNPGLTSNGASHTVGVAAPQLTPSATATPAPTATRTPAPPPAAASAFEPSVGRAGESAGAPIPGTDATGTNAAVIEVLPEKGTGPSKKRPVPPRVAHSRVAVHGVGVGRTTRAMSVARRASELSGSAFVLLPYVEPLRPTEMRHIMRVRMPRAQLAAGGVQAESVDDAVLADVLVGEDGTARAVRIVQ